MPRELNLFCGPLDNESERPRRGHWPQPELPLPVAVSSTATSLHQDRSRWLLLVRIEPVAPRKGVADCRRLLAIRELDAEAEHVRWQFTARSYPAIRPKGWGERDRKSTRLNSSHVAISYAVFC